MITRQIYFIWDKAAKRYIPSGLKPDEVIDAQWRGDKQGAGVGSVAAWLGAMADEARHIEFSLDLLYAPTALDGPVQYLMGGKSHWKGHVWAEINKGAVIIWFEYDDDPEVLMSIDQAIYILEQYNAVFEETKIRRSGKIISPIDVEFIAQGPEAAALFRKMQGA